MSLDSLVKRAERVDKIDMITGPISALCYHSGSEVLAGVGGLINTIELAIKIPFAISYVRETNDKKALFYWTVKELFANFNPELGYIDVFPAYSLRVKYKTSCGRE